VFRRKVLSAAARMKSADSLDVAASRDPIRTRTRRPGRRSCYSALRLPLHTQKIIKNDTCGLQRLSKIAHMRRIIVACQDWIKAPPFSRAKSEFAAKRPTES